MGRFRHVVVAVDGSEPSDRAAAFAVSLAARGALRLSFASAVNPTVASIPAGQGVAVGVASLFELLKVDAQNVCAAATGAATARGVTSDVHVLQGPPAEALATFVRESHADALIVGTHARRWLARSMLGSVAAALVRRCDVPVIVVRADSTLRDDGPIVVAVDGTPPSFAALEAATALARVVDTPLQRIRVDHPHPEAALVAAAAHAGAWLLATGTHGRTALKRLVLGSVAEALLREAPVPVMTVRFTANSTAS